MLDLFHTSLPNSLIWANCLRFVFSLSGFLSFFRLKNPTLAKFFYHVDVHARYRCRQLVLRNDIWEKQSCDRKTYKDHNVFFNVFFWKKVCTADLLIFVHLCSIFPAPPSAVPVPDPKMSETFQAALTLKFFCFTTVLHGQWKEPVWVGEHHLHKKSN